MTVHAASPRCAGAIVVVSLCIMIFGTGLESRLYMWPICGSYSNHDLCKSSYYVTLVKPTHSTI